MNTILVCDDELDIVNALRIYLEAEGYKVLSAYNGLEALEVIKNESVECVLLDIMMPEMDGIQTLVKIRELSNVPVLFLSAKSEDTDKILGLNLGADDYVTKPFNPVEVIARVKSQLRRYKHLGGSVQTPDVVQVDGLELNDKTKEVRVDGELIKLTPTEYLIIRMFISNPNHVFSPQEIYRNVWQDNPIGNESTVAVHIRHIREKIEIDPADPKYIKVVWGQGYKLEGGNNHERK